MTLADLVVPRLGATVTEVTIVEWLVEDGGQATAGEPILTVATDKAEIEIEATISGTLRHGGQPDDEFAVGAVIGSID
jgi:pyruvate/2-oxoglutarate dehydrogenase complex dihydrolipoamide acyltransferase (E2) component